MLTTREECKKGDYMVMYVWDSMAEIYSTLYPKTFFGKTTEANMIRSKNLCNLNLWNFKDVDRAVFPVHTPAHWSVCLQERRLVYLDSKAILSPYIQKKTILKAFKKIFESKVVLPEVAHVAYEPFTSKVNPEGTNQQTDSSACGFFSLGWAELFAQGVPEVWSVMDMARANSQRKQVEQFLRHAKLSGDGNTTYWRPDMREDVRAEVPAENALEDSDSDSDYDPDAKEAHDSVPQRTTMLDVESLLQMGRDHWRHGKGTKRTGTELDASAGKTGNDSGMCDGSPSRTRSKSKSKSRASRRPVRRRKKKLRPGDAVLKEDPRYDDGPRERIKIHPEEGDVALVASGKNWKREHPTEVNIATWNVTSITHNISEVNRAGGIDMERSQQVTRILYLMQKMKDEDLYLMCLQETRLPDKVFKYESGYVLVNHNTDRSSHYGVGVLLSPNAYLAWNRMERNRIVDGNGRSILLELATQVPEVSWYVLSQYSPRSKDPGAVRLFYTKAKSVMERIHANGHITLCGDYNGSVGRTHRGASAARRQVVGSKNPELLTENGDALVEFCMRFGLTLPQTYQDTGALDGITWVGNAMMRCKPRTYDYIICRRRQRSWYQEMEVRKTTWQGINTPHYPVVVTIRSGLDVKRHVSTSTKNQSTRLDSREKKLSLDCLMEGLQETRMPATSKGKRGDMESQVPLAQPDVEEENVAQRYWGYLLDNMEPSMTIIREVDTMMRNAGVLCENTRESALSWDHKNKQKFAELAQVRRKALKARVERR